MIQHHFRNLECRWTKGASLDVHDQISHTSTPWEHKSLLFQATQCGLNQMDERRPTSFVLKYPKARHQGTLCWRGSYYCDFAEVTGLSKYMKHHKRLQGRVLRV